MSPMQDKEQERKYLHYLLFIGFVVSAARVLLGHDMLEVFGAYVISILLIPITIWFMQRL